MWLMAREEPYSSDSPRQSSQKPSIANQLVNRAAPGAESLSAGLAEVLPLGSPSVQAAKARKSESCEAGGNNPF